MGAAVLQSPPPHHLHHLYNFSPIAEGVACVGFLWSSCSWDLAPKVLQLQPELWRLGNGSEPNYNDWLPVCWHFSDGDCWVCWIQGEGGGAASYWASPVFLCLRTARGLGSDWLERKEMSHDLARQNWWRQVMLHWWFSVDHSARSTITPKITCWTAIFCCQKSVLGIRLFSD